MNEPYFITLCKQLVALSDEFHKTRAISVATELADKFYEYLKLDINKK